MDYQQGRKDAGVAGANATATTSTFGQPASTGFGSTSTGTFGQTNNTFGAPKPAGGLFGSTTAPTAGFGSTSTGFGSTNNTGGGLFGSQNNQQQSSSPFGAQQNNTGGLFGQNNQQQQQQPASGGLFGNSNPFGSTNTTQQSASTGFTFGAPKPATTGFGTGSTGTTGFGSTPAAGSSTFGQANTGSTGFGGFGQPNQQQQQTQQPATGGGLFGGGFGKPILTRRPRSADAQVKPTTNLLRIRVDYSVRTTSNRIKALQVDYSATRQPNLEVSSGPLPLPILHRPTRFPLARTTRHNLPLGLLASLGPPILLRQRQEVSLGRRSNSLLSNRQADFSVATLEAVSLLPSQLLLLLAAVCLMLLLLSLLRLVVSLGILVPAVSSATQLRTLRISKSQADCLVAPTRVDYSAKLHNNLLNRVLAYSPMSVNPQTPERDCLALPPNNRRNPLAACLVEVSDNLPINNPRAASLLPSTKILTATRPCSSIAVASLI